MSVVLIAGGRERIGKFRISCRLLSTQPELVRKIMGECIIVRAEMLYEAMCIEYTALSEWFDFIPEGEYAPLYAIKFVQQGSSTKWAFEKDILS